MLLPSDVARLVLGYLQHEKLTSTCRTFITESPNLKEYAEHYTDDGNIPGCLLSLFGKSLTTILNEYITMKAKENQAETPFMMSSLWKKLDLTLSQIRCVQESAAFNTHQRSRTRKGINDRLHHRMLTSSPASSVQHPVIQQTSTPLVATQYILQPLNTSGPLQSVASPLFGGQSTIQRSNTSAISIVEPAQSSSVTLAQSSSVTLAQKKQPPSGATSSPMRRKPDVQRRRRVAQPSSTVTAPDEDIGGDSDSVPAIIDDAFPQMVIENAREKILSNKSLQEKLAENINKFLGSDSASQTTKQGDGATTENDPSIDEILGLQGGEIHMSEEAIHDILAQTELDPDFQELYDLFACVATKAPKNPSRDSLAPNNVTGKGKKVDTAERSFEMEVEPSKKKADVLLGGDELDSSETGKTGTYQQPLENETSCPENQSHKCNGQDTDLVIVDSTDSDLLMDTSKESSRTALGSSSSQSQLVKNNNCAAESAEDGCHFVKEISPPTSTVSGKVIFGNGKISEVQKETECSQGADNERPLEQGLQEDADNVPPPRVSLTVPHQKGVEAVSAETLTLKCISPQTERRTRPIQASKHSPSTKPGDDATSRQMNAADASVGSESQLSTQNSAVNVESAACKGQSNLASEMVAPNNCNSVPSGSQTVMDASNIVTLSIIPDVPEDSELHNAVQSIDCDTYPTIILSPLVKGQDAKRAGAAHDSTVVDLTDSFVSGDQSQVLTSLHGGAVSAINIPSGDCAVFSLSGTPSAADDGNIIQLMPAPSSAFAPGSNIFISTCMGNTVPAKQSNLMMLSNNAAVSGSQKPPSLFQTPPRPGSVYTVGQAISPKLSQGSTIILASPVQPVLQSVVGMIPVSLVGQSGNAFTAQPHQLLQVPISKPVVPKLPLPPKSQKALPPKPAIHTGKPLLNPAVDSSSRPSSSVVQSVENAEQKSPSEAQSKPNEKLSADRVGAKPVETHRRVLCFDGTVSSTVESPKKLKGQKTSKNDTVPKTPPSSGDAKSHTPKEKKTEGSVLLLGKNSKADFAKASGSVTTPVKDQAGEKRSLTPSVEALGNKENLQQDGCEKLVAAEEDKNVSRQDTEVGRCDKTVKPPQETTRKQTSLPNILRRTPQKTLLERACPASPLVKQASQLLQGMQFQSPNSKPLAVEDLPIPRTPGSGMDDKQLDHNLDDVRTPCRRYNDGGTPKLMKPPATPELPTCSPASEAGSESSVNMAAHTLMILSRASIAKSGSTPLKDNIQQLKSSKSASRKRKLEEDAEFQRPSHSKEPLSPSALQKKKMKKQRKKSMDCFPAGMDVEKFLMSLHYDE